jgi:CubicO group peptidase (beta-lactamase class C family)
MNAQRTARFIYLALSFSFIPLATAAEEFTNAIHAYLQHRAEVEWRPGGIVIGIADEHSSSIISYGKLNDVADQDVNGDSVFALHSGTGWFTALLLQDMIDRGEMKLDDPVAKYLPQSVKMPTYQGKEITLRHLVSETSGLPDFGDKLDPKRADDPFADFSVEKMYAFLSGHQLGWEPGQYYGHGGVALGLLGHVIGLKAGTNYESLVQERICRPLKMDSTRATLTPELTSRLVTEYNQAGYPTRWAEMDWGVLTPLAGLHSTVNDLLRFVAALGLRPSKLTPLMEESLAHFPDSPQGRGIILFGGGGFDETQRRCVVIKSATVPNLDGRKLLVFLLESEWRFERRPKEAKISSQLYSSYAGQYERSRDLALGMFALRQVLGNKSRTAIYVPAALGLAALVALLWRTRSVRKRCAVLGGLILLSGLAVPLVLMASSRAFRARFHPGMGIHREGDRLFAQPTGSNLWPIADYKFAKRMFLKVNPIDVLVPPVQTELMPQSETRFFERLSGMPMIFSRDAPGKVTGLTVHYQGRAIAYHKISDQPPQVAEPPKPGVAIKLDPKLLDACVGRYEIPPDALSPSGAKLVIWREGDHLVGQIWGKHTTPGAMDIYPESQTNFFIKNDGSQLTFIKNNRGEVTDVIHHFPGVPDHKGKKLPDPAK